MALKSFCLLSLAYLVTSMTFRDSIEGHTLQSFYSSPSAHTINNSTWSSYLVANGVSTYTRLRPSYISNDKELDLFLFEAARNISWLGNIRGSSHVLNLHTVGMNAKGMIVTDFDKEFKEDVLMITENRKYIILYKKSQSFHKTSWKPTVLFDINNSTELITDLSYKISSFLVSDTNNDGVNDLVIALDYTFDVQEKTLILRALMSKDNGYKF